jgi:hypothetical protein
MNGPTGVLITLPWGAGAFGSPISWAELSLERISGNAA